MLPRGGEKYSVVKMNYPSYYPTFLFMMKI